MKPVMGLSRRQPAGASLRRWAVESLPSFLHPVARNAVLAGTAVVGTAMRALPGDSRRLGPPRRFVRTLAEYAHRHPDQVSYREIHPAHDLRREVPITLDGQIHPAFYGELHRRTWATGVAEIRNGRVLTSSGAVISPDDALIYDVSHTAASDDPRSHSVFLARKLPPLTRAPERVAVLTTYTSNVPNMFYFVHWLLDTLPRLHLIERSGIHWDKLVAPQATRFHRETLQLLGIAADRIICEPDLYIEADRLIVPTLPALPVNPPKWVCDYLRDKFIAMACAPGSRPLRPGRKLYFSRAKAKTRRVENESKLIDALEAQGFERIFLEDYPFLEQVRIMQESSIVVAPHGAANASLVFCNPGVCFVEIFSPKYVNVCYWSLCEQVGIRYAYVLGEGRGGGRQAHEAITAPIADLLKLVGLAKGGDA